MIKTSTYYHTKALDQIAKDFGAKSATINFTDNTATYQFDNEDNEEVFTRVCITMANNKQFHDFFNWMDYTGRYNSAKVYTISGLMQDYSTEGFLNDEDAAELAALCKMGIEA